ncbi:MAG: hypothetical protein SFU56_10935 [Capsulimonadales bacterium]|nr:hypothetical protein [Capsulimonadales bacterium]
MTPERPNPHNASDLAPVSRTMLLLLRRTVYAYLSELRHLSEDGLSIERSLSQGTFTEADTVALSLIWTLGDVPLPLIEGDHSEPYRIDGGRLCSSGRSGNHQATSPPFAPDPA